MVPRLSSLTPAVRQLLEALTRPERCSSLDGRGWDVLIRVARAANLLGVLASRLGRDGAAASAPQPVRETLESALLAARHRRQMARHELDSVWRALRPASVPVLLLKGVAYIEQGLPCADGRMLEDIDVMVPRARLADAERLLIEAGWELEKKDAYDQHYYRAWSHELPPLRYPGHAFQVDVHHAILPPTGRVQPDVRALWEASVSVPDRPFLVLAPVDQLLHCAAHAFQDSDCTGRLRDLVDLDSLARTFVERDPHLWRTLAHHARRHELASAIWFALAFARAWLGTPVPLALLNGERLRRPVWVGRACVTSLAGRTLPPPDPDRLPGRGARWAAALMAARAAWLRMPPWLLAYHATRKALRRWRSPAPDAAPSESP
jgi:hypothetical protein